MKTILITAALFAALTTTAQTVQQDDNGNFIEVAKSKTKAQHDSTTTRTFIAVNGTEEPVYVGVKGAYYVARISKQGNYYRKYLSSGTATFHAPKD